MVPAVAVLSAVNRTALRMKSSTDERSTDGAKKESQEVVDEPREEQLPHADPPMGPRKRGVADKQSAAASTGDDEEPASGAVSKRAKGTKVEAEASYISRLMGKAPTVKLLMPKEETYLPLICLIFMGILWYWMSSSHRRVARMCESSRALSLAKLKEVKDDLARLEKTWKDSLKSREEQIRQVQEQNSDLTRVIDQMTSELRRCS